MPTSERRAPGRDRVRTGVVWDAVVARLDPNTALLVVAAWLIGGLVVTVLYTERAEISG